ncbi:hypothetical protein [Staphylococcus aureus]|uniref:hypothetical protein n=1 Tax=Staphylococcus aureus TaxID=1280 RepID=UPI000E04A13B|nr:bacteriocin, lactococcin 972 family protein [Staphylococcus aureus]
MKKKFVSSCIASTILFGTLLGVTYKAEAANSTCSWGCLEPWYWKTLRMVLL